MTVNNIEHIKPFLKFNDSNTFYFIQILKRRKENPEMSVGVKVINNYYLYGNDDIERLMVKVISDCELNNARAYINLNRLDAEKIALYTMKIVADKIVAKEFKSVKNAYSAACGSYHSEKVKRWVVDIDTKDEQYITEVRSAIEELHATTKKKSNKPIETFMAQIPTKNGVHIITSPFDYKTFGSKYPKIDVNKNSPTILYIP